MNRETAKRGLWAIILCPLFIIGCSQQPGEQDCAEDPCPPMESDVGGVDVPGLDPGHRHDGGHDHDADLEPCVPSQSAWDNHARAIVESHCGTCHGESPQFGAPYGLLNYDELIADRPEGRRVDAMADTLIAGDMPPPAFPPLMHSDLHSLVGWASCGQRHPDPQVNLEASAPVWQAPLEPPPGLEYFDVLASDYEVGATELDNYVCFSVELPIGDSRFIRRIEPVIDEGRVLHHTVVAIDRRQNVPLGVFACPALPPGDDYLYAWGPGQGPIQFPEGGFRINPGDRMVLQIHYNNGAGIEGVRDSSGLRVYHQAPGGPEYVQAQQSTMNIYVPPGQTAERSTTCTVQEEADLIAVWPHMHAIGSEFRQIVTRANGTVETIIGLTGWRFEAQLIYYTPKTLYPGDRLTTTCVWDNPYDRAVLWGTGSADEMCMSFMYVTPARANFCR